jgi:hypothetical protein
MFKIKKTSSDEGDILRDLLWQTFQEDGWQNLLDLNDVDVKTLVMD